MADSPVREGHSIIACPVCAKNGNGRGALQSYFQPGETSCLRCEVCGWKGDYNSVQRYEYPCKIYTVVEIDLAVVENLLGFALQLDERPTITVKDNGFDDPLDYCIDRTYTGTPPSDGCCCLDEALCYLVAKGWLFPAFYKVINDD